MTLIERICAAEAGSFELDCEIALSTGLYVREKRGKDRQEWFYSTVDGHRKHTTPYVFGIDRVPCYTASVDSALSLVTGVVVLTVKLVGDTWEVFLVCDQGDAQGEGKTMITAICAAAIQARTA